MRKISTRPLPIKLTIATTAPTVMVTSEKNALRTLGRKLCTCQMDSPGETSALITFTINIVTATSASCACWPMGNRGIKPTSKMFIAIIMVYSVRSSAFLRGKRSKRSGANICNILAAVEIIVVMPIKPSSACISNNRPVRKVPPIQLAMMLAL